MFEEDDDPTDHDYYVAGAIMYVLSRDTTPDSEAMTEEEIVYAVNNLTLEEELAATKIANELREDNPDMFDDFDD